MTVPEPDARWSNIVGGRGETGEPLPMTFDVLRGLADEWAEIVPAQFGEDHGPVALLRLARSVFTLSWFDYECMVLACLVAFQAMEAAFHVLYTDASERTP